MSQNGVVDDVGISQDDLRVRAHNVSLFLTNISIKSSRMNLERVRAEEDQRNE